MSLLPFLPLIREWRDIPETPRIMGSAGKFEGISVSLLQDVEGAVDARQVEAPGRRQRFRVHQARPRLSRILKKMATNISL